mgnify:CR=1 FL=1
MGVVVQVGRTRAMGRCYHFTQQSEVGKKCGKKTVVNRWRNPPFQRIIMISVQNNLGVRVCGRQLFFGGKLVRFRNLYAKLLICLEDQHQLNLVYCGVHASFRRHSTRPSQHIKLFILEPTGRLH